MICNFCAKRVCGLAYIFDTYEGSRHGKSWVDDYSVEVIGTVPVEFGFDIVEDQGIEEVVAFPYSCF